MASSGEGNIMTNRYQWSFEHFHILDFVEYVYPKSVEESIVFEREKYSFRSILTFTGGLGRLVRITDMLSN